MKYNFDEEITKTVFFKRKGSRAPNEENIFQKQPTEVFYKKGVLINFAVFIGKNLCWSLFLIKNSQNMFFLKFVSPLFIITANFGNTNRSRKTFLKSWNARIILEHFRCCHFVEVIAAILFKDMGYIMYMYLVTVYRFFWAV